MNLRKALAITILFFSLNAVGQFKYLDITQKAIPIQPIDTTLTFIYEVQNFKLIFAQSDIINYFSKLQAREKKEYKLLIDTLTQSHQSIIIKQDFIYDTVYTRNHGNGAIETGVFRSWKDKRDIMAYDFRNIAADLMLEGKVLILSTKKRKLKIEKIICRKVKGQFGNESLVFELLNKKKIYEIVTLLGE